jgi:hypothetical protein
MPYFPGICSALYPKYSYSDNFTRADNAASLGANWTNQLNVMGIISNTAYPVTNTASGYATYNSVMGTDNHQASYVCATVTSGHGLYLFIASSNSVQIASYVNNAASYIYTGAGTWAAFDADQVQQATVATGMAAADVFIFRRVGNVFTLYQNGTSTLSWTDASNIIPTGPTQRMVGIGGYQASSAYASASSWSAKDL